MVDQDFLKDFSDLLTGRKVAHMGRYMYADHAGTHNGLSMSGARLWQRLADEEPLYTISRADTALLQNELPEIAHILPKKLTLFDLGPGGERSITSKSVKLIAAAEITHYNPVDSSAPFTDTAVHIAQSKFPELDVHPLHENIFLGTHGIKEPTLAYFGGGTISNLIHPLSDTFPDLLFEDVLDTLLTYAPYGWFLTSFDSTNDAERLATCYNNKACNDFVCNVVYRAAVELPLENFDPAKFTIASQWRPKSYQYAHLLMSQENQNIILNGEKICIDKGQTFHITNSYKFPRPVFEEAVAEVGYSVDYNAVDSTGMALYLLRSPFAPAIEKGTVKLRSVA